MFDDITLNNAPINLAFLATPLQVCWPPGTDRPTPLQVCVPPGTG
jgi:hypothetical protein